MRRKLKVGRRELDLSAPDDLDAQLAETTGHNAKEMRALLATWCPPGLIARALAPLVKDAPPVSDLATTIAKAGVDEVRAVVRNLYDDLAKKKAADAQKSA